MNNEQPRRTSFGMLLRRSKSGDLGKGGRKAQALREAELERQRQASTRIAPKLPEFANHSEQLSKSFGPELRPESPANVPRSADYTAIRPSAEYPRGYGAAAHAAVPVPPLPNGGFDPYARTESMTNRGRYSYASSAISTVNSPRRVRRRKDPTPLNILVIGTRNSGKTSFLEFLKTALALPPKKRAKKGDDEVPQNRNTPSGNFIPHYLETEIDGERVGLTIWDSEGLEKNVVDLQLREMSAFLESKFEETFAEEMKVVRSPGVQDTHIHATFLVLDPSRLDRNIASARNPAINGQQNGHLGARVLGSLDEDLDLQVLRTLQGKTTVIPVIAKADTITTKHMNVLKRSEFPLQGHRESPAASPSSKRLSTSSIRRHKAQEEAKEKEDEIPFLPLSIISPDLYEPGVIGRQFPWGFADPYNEEHCDFQRLKEAVFSEWRAELREASREQWYEGWRTNRLKQRDVPYRHR
ncbi:hypothetical protein RAB80_011143 [Fusarium oxysporum f. sp. vasinfectum]|nr:hypothetical protein RAB80_011143 [Fusarium oxysporum f. sp. vasinfectum]